MPKKKTVTTVEEIDPPLAAEIERDVETGFVGSDEELPEDVQQVIAQLGADVSKVVLYKRNKTGKQPYVATYAAAEFDLETVKDAYGGGDYLAKIYYTRDGQTRPVLHRFQIEESIKPLPPEVRALRDGNGMERLLERMLDRLDNTGGGRSDPMAIAAEFAKASAQQTASTIQMMMPLIEKMAGGGKGTGLADLMSVMEFALDRFGGKEEGYMPVVREVGIPLVRLIEQHLSKGGTVAPTQPASALPPGAPEWVPTIRAALKSIFPYIQGNKDPVLVAANVDLQSPRLAHWLEERVLDPNFRAQLLQYVPEIGPFMPWVEQFLAEFLPDDAGNGVTTHEPDEPDE